MSEVTQQQVEAWILESNDPTSVNQTAAVQTLGTCAASPWASPMLFQLLRSQHIHVRFYALTTLGRIKDATLRSQLRAYLLQLPDPQPNFMTNKAAGLLSLCMILDGGTPVWGTLENDLLRLAVANPTLYLYTIKAVLDDFHHVSSISYDNEPSTGDFSTNDTRRFKEVLKGYHANNNSATLLEQLFDTVVKLLERSISSSRVDQQLIGLQTLSGFFRWTEVLYLGNSAVPRCLEILLFFVDPSKRNDLQKASLTAWEEYITSSSVIDSSISSIQSVDDPKLPAMIQLMERIHATNLLPYTCNTEDVDADTMEVVIEMASVVNSAGLEILPLYEMHRRIETLFNQILDLFLRAFSYDDIDVSSAVLPLAIRLVEYMKENTTNSLDLTLHLPLMLNKLYDQMKYPDDFQFDYEDEDDAEEEVFRRELGKVYNKLVRVAPSVCLQFVEGAATSNLSGDNAAAVSTSDAEASLRLLYHYSESVTPMPGLRTVMKNEKFVQIVVRLHNSSIARHPHREVICLYYETAVRYCSLFLDNTYTHLLGPLLSTMTSEAGLQHEHPRVRSRCCYLLLKLVKVTVKLLRPFVETAVSGIQGLISNPSLELRPDDTLFLFETIGLLLGQTNLPAVDEQRYLTAVITPHVHSIEAVLKTPAIQNDFEQSATILSSSVAAIAYLSKGFSKPADEVKAVLTETLSIVLSVLEALPTSEDVRGKCMIFLQRMIICVDKNVFGVIPKFLQILIAHCTSDDILFVSQVFNQVAAKFKGEAVVLLDNSLLPFLQKCQTLSEELVDGMGTAPPHLRTEQLSIQKLCFLTLVSLVSKGAVSVLFTPVNQPSFEKILAMMQEGAVNTSDPGVRRSCFRFFREVVSQLNNELLLGFVCNSLIPKALLSMASSLDLNDANESRVLSEFSGLVWQLKQKHPLVYHRSMEKVHLAQIAPSTAKDLEKCFAQVIQSSK